MSKMKAGTNVGLDKNYNNICVGDSIKDKDGYIYTISQYGMAVRNDGGGTFKLSDLTSIELWTSPDNAAVKIGSIPDADLLAEVKKRGLNYTESPEIAKCLDAELAAELRARGYEVKATKTTIIEL